MKEKYAEFLEVLQGWRKFLMCFFILSVSIVFRLKSLVSGGEWSDLAKTTVVSFCAVNGLEGITTCVKEHLAARRAAGNVLTPTSDPAPEDGNKEVEIEPIGASDEHSSN